MKIKIVLLLGYACLFASPKIWAAPADAPTRQASQQSNDDADDDWRILKAIIDSEEGLGWMLHLGDVDGEEGGVVFQAMSRAVRARGLAFAEKYPHDPRRLMWLPAAVRHPPHYWKNPKAAIQAQQETINQHRSGTAPVNVADFYFLDRAPWIDETAKAEWDEHYGALRAEFMSSSFVADTERARLLLNELFVRLADLRRPGADVAGMRNELRRDVLDLGKLPLEWPVAWSAGAAGQDKSMGTSIWERCRDLEQIIDSMTRNPLLAGDDEEQAAFEDAMKASPSELLRHIGYSKAQLSALKKRPMSLRFTAMDGREIDLAKFRGKVVLVEYWSIGCVSCIAQVPTLKRIYDKYHDSGFEIIGLCDDEAKDKEKVLDFEKNQGIDWPQRLDHAKVMEEFGDYSFDIMSTMLLFDKQGLLAKVSSGLTEDELEGLVRKYLGRHHWRESKQRFSLNLVVSD